ncbi:MULTISPECIES: site-specific DNA-methyltransferase [unclassified Clostridioides]|uniref:site-specific DNA-methyltransferase n=1 Tax=unclassified Clostridioides TaxID=2635829 RepID=UPI001D0F5ED3|nr:site-specific DNA-methyltransferase [Clostridioides sp. ZZV14-6105]MCC0744684.1 site-specific DNA-methyltransferase [Clostridioides sp. ZZV14-6044]
MRNVKKLSGKTFDAISENIKKLEEIFPELVTEGKVDVDKLAILFDKAKNEDVEEEIDVEERYEFTWKGKKEALRLAQKQTSGTLRPCKKESVNWDDTQNLYIEGDNLEVLRVLQNSYRSRVKMIYIDPPYNTGNDFVYKDDFSDNIKNYKEMMNESYKTNTDSNGRYHTNWLNMMYPRLKLARNLLTEDGVIFISIDDNEIHNLRKICDEIFGAMNFITNIGLEITKTQGMKVKAAKEGSVVKNYEYILCYAKSNLNKNIVSNILYDSNPNYDTHFSYYIDRKGNKLQVKKLMDIIVSNKEIYDEFNRIGLVKNGKISINDIEQATYISEKIKKYIYVDIAEHIYQEMACNIKVEDYVLDQLKKEDAVEYNSYILTLSSGGKLRQYSSLKETLNYSDEYKSVYGRTTIRGNLWKGFYSDMMNVSKEGDIEYKNAKKPIRLVKQLAKWIGLDNNDILLDFFSGSATSAHAIIQLNIEEGKNIRYIMVQIPEDLEKNLKVADTTTKKNINETISFLDGINKPRFITEIGKERIRRASKRIVHENRENEWVDNLDIGFKVFELDSTNIKEWDETVQDIEQMVISLESPIKDGRNEDDIVYEILLKYGVDISTSIEEVDIMGSKVYSVEFGHIMICLEEDISLDLIEAIGEQKPSKVILYDNGLDNESKINGEIILRNYGVKDIRTI